MCGKSKEVLTKRGYHIYADKILFENNFTSNASIFIFLMWYQYSMFKQSNNLILLFST